MALKDQVKETALKMLVALIIKYMTEDRIKKWVDSGLDDVEDAIAKSKSKIDDILIGPVIKTVRAAFDIPDNDEA